MKFFLPLSFIIIAIILFATIVSPYYTEVKQLRSDISDYNLALNNSTNLQKTQDSLIEKYKSIKSTEKDRLSNFLPNTVNNIRFILELEKIASVYNLEIKNLKFQTEQPQVEDTKKGNSVIKDTATNSPYGTFPVEFSVDTDYNTFIVFLKDLELNLRLIDVKSISFSIPAVSNSKTDTTNPNIYSYSLKIQTYWLK
jgi:hypothetical protein